MAVIAFIDSKHKWGGVATWNLQMAMGLREKGIRTHLICRRGGVNFFRYQKAMGDVAGVYFGPDYNPFNIMRLYFIFRKYRVTHVVVNVQKEIINAGIASGMAGCKTILRIGSAMDFKRRKKTEKLFSRHVDKIIVPCRGMREALVSRFSWLEPELFHVIYNGKKPLPEDFFEQREKNRKNMGFLPRHVVIGFVGQLSPVKNIPLLIEAFKWLYRQNKNVRLVIAGAGSEMDSLKEMVNQYGLGDAVHFTGYLSDVTRVLNVFDMGIITSESEGFPNTVLEYMMAGLPVIASDVGCIAEAVKHKKNGLLFDNGDVEGLKKQLSVMMESPAVRTAYGQSGKKIMAECFNVEKMVSEFVKLL